MSNSRKEKRFFRKAGVSDPVYEAWHAGQAYAMYGEALPLRLQSNPYPPGRRHDEWDRGNEETMNDSEYRVRFSTMH